MEKRPAMTRPNSRSSSLEVEPPLDTTLSEADTHSQSNATSGRESSMSNLSERLTPSPQSRYRTPSISSGEATVRNPRQFFDPQRRAFLEEQMPAFVEAQAIRRSAETDWYNTITDITREYLNRLSVDEENANQLAALEQAVAAPAAARSGIWQSILAALVRMFAWVQKQSRAVFAKPSDDSEQATAPVAA
ncbi:unnamed protein product [Peniophora sp. CBMAI 1063]|nr:unnamed protein product [Peniophora sp. CBMAI 1063]